MSGGGGGGVQIKKLNSCIISGGGWTLAEGGGPRPRGIFRVNTNVRIFGKKNLY